jgi:hypothetical protein
LAHGADSERHAARRQIEQIVSVAALIPRDGQLALIC